MKNITLKSFLNMLKDVTSITTEVKDFTIELHDLQGNFVEFAVMTVDNDGYDTETSASGLVNQSIDSLIFENLYRTKTLLYPEIEQLGSFIGELFAKVK